MKQDKEIFNDKKAKEFGEGRPGISFAISIGKWGGVYIDIGYSKRIVLGWISFTFFPNDIF